MVERTVSARWPLVGRGEDLDASCTALAEGEVRALFIHGAAGVGKSRLAEEIVGRITNVGRATVRVRASLASATIPLGALAHLLPMDLLDGRFDPLSVYGRVVASLREERAGRGPLVVLVDDAHWLDPTSAALVGQLLDGGEIMVVGTVRTGETVTAAVAGLWSRDDVRRLDLTELTFDDADALLHLALGGPIDRQAIGRLWAASAGNPLILRELVLGAVARGDMVQRRSVWWLRGSLASTPRLAEIIGQPSTRPARRPSGTGLISRTRRGRGGGARTRRCSSARSPTRGGGAVSSPSRRIRPTPSTPSTGSPAPWAV